MAIAIGTLFVRGEVCFTFVFMTGFKKWLVCSMVVLAGGAASAFTTNDADTIFNAYNTAFYAINSSGNGYYKNDKTSGQTYFWSQAEEIEMMLDSYDRTSSPATRTKITLICNGFVNYNGSDWTGNEYNDDIAWAVIVFSRAYLATGNTTFRNIAKANFDAMYSRAWDTTFAGGGLAWRRQVDVERREKWRVPGLGRVHAGLRHHRLQHRRRIHVDALRRVRHLGDTGIEDRRAEPGLVRE